MTIVPKRRPAEAPFVEMSEIAAPPVRGQETDDRDADEQQDEDEGCAEIHCAPPCVPLAFHAFLVLKYTNAVITALMKTQSNWYQ